MKNNKLKLAVVIVSILCLCGVTALLCVNSNKSEHTAEIQTTNVEQNQTANDDKKNSNHPIETTKTKQVEKKIENEEAAIEKDTSSNLFNDVPSSALPLSAIAEIAKLPTNIQNIILKITETNNIYMLQRHKDKLFIITDNSENIRHNVEFTEISLSNGHQIHTTLGYNDKIKDSDNDIWVYNEDTKLPTKHTKYNANGDMEFVEIWNYDNDNPIKYEMKDNNNNVISMRKETLQDGTDLRVEHLVYDDKGNTRVNVSVSYEGPDLKRFTYYDTDNLKNSGSIFSEYDDGHKIKEVVYTSDLKVKNSYTSDYKNGEREEITKWDNRNKEVEKYVQIDTL